MPLVGTTAAAIASQNADLVTHVLGSLCTRTLNHFAQEARLDGESLQQAVARYEIDYAWHVLGSPRMQAQAVAALEAKLARPLSSVQLTRVGEVLQQAAQGLAPDLLMSFDNDVPEALASRLFAQFGGGASAVPAGKTAAAQA